MQEEYRLQVLDRETKKIILNQIFDTLEGAEDIKADYPLPRYVALIQKMDNIKEDISKYKLEPKGGW
jgi:hypothetical protein